MSIPKPAGADAGNVTALPHSAVLDEVDIRVARRKGIGGSDVAAVLGVHPYRTAHDVWLEKFALVERELGEAALWGRVVEPAILDEYARREGVAVEKFEFPKGFRRHKQHDWMLGNIDAVVKGKPIGVDAKMAGLRQAPRWGETNTDEMPEEYLLQAVWYLAITELERWDVPVLLGQELRVYRVYPNRDLQNFLVEQCGEWWERYVLTKTPPPPDASRGARKMLEKLYPADQGAIRRALPPEEDLCWQYHRTDQAADAAFNERDRIKNLICAFIGEDAGIEFSGGRISWKRTRDGTATDWEAVAKELGRADPAALERAVKAASSPKPGVRRFLPKFDHGASR